MPFRRTSIDSSQRTGFYSPKRSRVVGSRIAYSISPDPDAEAYLLAVEAADGEPLEAGVVNAVTDFVVGCKSDGIWDAIKASCILAGARTLAGALVPLVGTAPTNNNFVSGDYSRMNGLVGDGSTKYLNSNRAGNADPQNNAHLSVYITAIASGDPGAAPYYISSGAAGTGAKGLFRAYSYPVLFAHGVLPTANTASALGPNSPLNGFFGYSRSLAASFAYLDSGTTYTPSTTSQVPTSDKTFVLARNNGSDVAERYSNARVAFYSIGESLDLALLDNRVTRLINEIEFFLNTGLDGGGYDIDTLKYVNAGYAAGGSLS